MNCKHLDKHRDYIIEQYQNPEITQVQIAKNLGVNPSTLNRYARKLGIKKTLKSKWTQHKIDWLKENYNLPYKELCKHLDLDDETIRCKLKELGIKRTSKYTNGVYDHLYTDADFLADLCGQRLTAREVSDKWGISQSRIWELRRNKGIKSKLNFLEHSSDLELRVKLILDKLDVCYQEERREGKYHIDFYLGYRICIEVQGSYWHKNRDADERKKAYLESLGYKVIYLWEKDIDENYIKHILKELGLPIQ